MSLLRNLFTSTRRLYRRVFQTQENEQFTASLQALQRSPLFRHAPSRALRELTEAVHQRDYRRDEFIYYERDPGLGLYVVQRGRVRLLTEDESGTAHELRKVDEHEAFGVLSLFGDFRRMETAQAVTETRLLGFFRPDLRTLSQRHPRTGTAVLMALARHLASRQVNVLKLIAEDKGKVAAMRTVDEAMRHMRRS